MAATIALVVIEPESRLVATVVTVLDPTALPESAVPRVTPAVKVVLGVLGAVVFGGIGLVALIRAGKPPR
ncbi:hypothetical protein V2J52_15695 [Georgenia sp. MJ173]|uniref:hypothetical protein n=1 Tax=Georgenia sunbinii TaxID=3117728 RepID=UPI002F265EDC